MSLEDSSRSIQNSGQIDPKGGGGFDTFWFLDRYKNLNFLFEELEINL